MKLLITGGAGYLGSLLTGILRNTEYELYIVDISKHNINTIAHFNQYKNINLINEDIFSYSIPEVDCIIHLAAIVGASACDRDPELTCKTNIDSTDKIALYAKQHNIPVIFASTCSIYAGTDPEKLCTENIKVNPESIYSKTKYRGEQLILDAGGMVLRFGTLCGWSYNIRYDLFVNYIAECARKNITPEIFDPLSVRPYANIYDVCEFIIHAALKEYKPGLYNVVNNNLSKIQIVNMMNNIMCPKQLEVNYIDKKDPRNYQASSDKLLKAFDFKFKLSINDALGILYQLI